MQDQSGTAISLLGFYLSLVSLLGSFFYVHLATWFRQIATTRQKWQRYKNGIQRDKQIECYLEAYDEKSWQPAIAFVLLTVFMIVLGSFAEQLRPLAQTPAGIATYLYWPAYIFFVMYVAVSLFYLVEGYRAMRTLYTDIDRKVSSGTR